jgi:hypothetical protein
LLFLNTEFLTVILESILNIAHPTIAVFPSNVDPMTVNSVLD